MRINVLITCLLLLGTSCIDLYFPDLDKYDNLLVIDGKLTDEPGPYTIRLNLSSDVRPLEYPPVTGAEVVIADDAGTSERLNETSPGVYQTDKSGIRGTAGRRYQLQIRTSDGQTYSSRPELLRASPGIDSIYAEVESHQEIGYDYDLVGYQFYLNGMSPQQNDNYYLMELEATYKYNADRLIYFVYDNGLRPFPENSLYYTCWKTFVVPEIFTFSTRNLSDPTLNRFPLHFVSTENKFLSIRYSLKTRQYSISSDAYLFWNSIREQISQEGSLYTQQPYQIRGNVLNDKDESEPVLGYFTVAGVAEKRIFVDRPVDLVFNYVPCELVTEDLGYIFLESSSWPIYVGQTDEGAIGIGGGDCLDCRAIDGTIEQPDFWIE
jgi:hypothetical protein